MHFVEFAHKEHYIASIVMLPAPSDLEIAAQRSTMNVTPKEMQQMI
jgi:hypothetical protein